MPTFKKIDPDEVDLARGRSHSRVSYPIVKGFMDTNFYLAQVDLSDTPSRKAPTMVLLLKSYIQNHDLPIKAILRRNALYLMRLDIDKEGKPVENWKAIRDAEIIGEVIGDSGVIEIQAKPQVIEAVEEKELEKAKRK